MREEIITDCSKIAHCDSHTELFAKIKAPHFRILCQVPRRPGTEDLSFSHDVSAVRYTQGFTHIVVGYEDADAATDHNVRETDRKSTRLNSSHLVISYAVFCLKKK